MLPCCKLVISLEEQLDINKSLIIVTLSTSLFSLRIVLVQNWFCQGLCLWAAWSPTWESLQLVVLFSLFHLGLQSWGMLSKRISAELFSIRKCRSQKMKILQEVLLIFEEISTSGRKCIPNMFYVKVFDIKLLNFPCPVFFQNGNKHYNVSAQQNGITSFQLSFR